MYVSCMYVIVIEARSEGAFMGRPTRSASNKERGRECFLVR